MKSQADTVCFRVDASLDLGTGHVVRCLTLANALRLRRATCVFVCRDQPGHLMAQIRDQGHEVRSLPPAASAARRNPTSSRLATDAGESVDWGLDAEETAAAISGLQLELMVVDSYALDKTWETRLRGHSRRLLVLDDLANREHSCDVLIDQNLGRLRSDYSGLVPVQAELLVGPMYALLRPEFAALREYSLHRRDPGHLESVLVSMGGVDAVDATSSVLRSLQFCRLPADCQISVVMGSSAPWLQRVTQLSREMPWPTEVHVGVRDLGQRMADSDLAIGAAGGTAWERCCLGLPTLLAVVADNQWSSARALAGSGAACLLGDWRGIADSLPTAVNGVLLPRALQNMSRSAAEITDGRGIDRICHSLELDRG